MALTSALDILSVDDAKVALRIDGSDEDIEVETCVHAAVAYCAGKAKRPYIGKTETFEVPKAVRTDCPIIIRAADIHAVTAIAYWQTDQELREMPNGGVATPRTVFSSLGPVLTVSGGSGTDAAVGSIMVNSDGALTEITWSDGGSDYEVDDVLTFAQGAAVAKYTVASGDVSGGTLQTLTGLTLAPTNLIGRVHEKDNQTYIWPPADGWPEIRTDSHFEVTVERGFERNDAADEDPAANVPNIQSVRKAVALMARIHFEGDNDPRNLQMVQDILIPGSARTEGLAF